MASTSVSASNTTAAAASTAELKLINNVELRLAMSNDAQFENLLKVYLGPILLKLESPFPANRAKTVAVLSMIDNRLAGGMIKIPFEALLQQYHDPKIAQECKDTVVRYLDIALKFAKNDGPIIPQLMRGFALASSVQQPVIFSMICCLIKDFKAPTNTTDIENVLDLYRIDSPADEAALTKRFIDLMLLNLGYFSGSKPSTFGASSTNVGDVRPSPGAGTQAISSRRSAINGLTEEDIRFLTPDGSSTFTVTSLNQIKAGLLRYIHIPVMKSPNRFIIGLVGSLNLKDELQILGSTAIRHCEVPDNKEYADSLYDLILRRQQVDHHLQVKVYQLLSKSSAAVMDYDSAMKAITSGVESHISSVRTASIGFLQWFARFAPVGDSQSTHQLLSQLTRFLGDTEALQETKSSAYIAIGLLCKRDLKFAQENVDIVQMLFTALSIETVLRPAVSEALSSLIYAYTNAPSDSLTQLKAVLLDAIVNKPAHTHHTALRFCLATYPFSDAGARWICILAMGKSSNLQVTQEAKKGLNIYHFQLLQQRSIESAKYPDLTDFIDWPTETLVNGGYMNLPNIQELDSQILDAFIRFSRSALYANALIAVNNGSMIQQESYEQNLHDIVLHDLSVRSSVSQFLAQLNVSDHTQGSNERVLHKFYQILKETFFRHCSTAAGTALLELLILCPEPFSSAMISDISQIRTILDSESEEMRTLSKRIFAIVITTKQHCDSDVAEHLRSLVSASSEGSSTGLRAISLLCKILLGLELRGRNLYVDLHNLETIMLGHLQGNDNGAIKLCLDAVGDLALTTRMAARSDYASALFQLIDRKAKQGETHVIEQATLALGYIACGLSVSSREMEQIVEILIGRNAEVLKIDQLLASGEALASCLGCWQSTALQASIEVPSGRCDMPLEPGRGDLAKGVVDRLLSLTRSSRPAERKGACIRLISLVQLLKLPEIHARFADIHLSFLSLLSDKDDFIVESANKGIQVVYEKSEQKQKDILVAQLLSTMTSDSAAKLAGNTANRDADTELFVPGTIAVGSGEQETSLSTYKDICNLAMDAGNNSLIYSFLSLASSSSMWSTRRGAALGLNSLLSSGAGADIAAKSPDMLRRLLPKLYRYKHDPSTKVSSAMKGIFEQLFPDSKHALDKNFSSVLAELLKCLGDSQWRVRESATSALTSLISGRPVAQFQENIGELWTSAFRVLDDVKESVRTAAVALCKSLANIALKSAGNESDQHRSSDTILETAIPLFLKHLKSTSIEISSFSLETLLKITKAAGRAIRPHLPLLIEEYLVLTTTMEPEVMNYLGFHASKYNLSQADLDGHRLASMRTSPLIEALEQCIDQLDAKTADVALPRVCNVIRQTNGLPTRAAISRFVISFTTRNPSLMSKHADSVLQALSGTLKDRNETVVTLSASSIGYLARVASDEKIIKLMAFLSRNQFESDDHNNAQGLVLKAISQNANDRLNSLGDVFLPICFFAMHDTDEKAKSNYKQAWENNTGSVGAVKLYLKEILALVEKYLTSPIWRVKQMSATTLAEIATTIDLGSNTQRVLALVVDALNGKSWNGKESVLQAFVALLKRSMKGLPSSQVAEYRILMRREVKRTNMSYKRHALVHYATFLELDSQDDDDEAFSKVHEMVEDLLDGDEMDLDDDDDDDEEDGKSLRSVLVQNAMKCLLTAYRPSIDPECTTHYRTLLKYATSLAVSEPWNVKTQICTDLGVVFSRIAECSTDVFSEDLVQDTWSLLKSLMQDRSYASLREEAAKSTVKFAVSCRSQECGASQDISTRMKTELVVMLGQEQSTIVQGVLRTIQF